VCRLGWNHLLQRRQRRRPLQRRLQLKSMSKWLQQQQWQIMVMANMMMTLAKSAGRIEKA